MARGPFMPTHVPKQARQAWAAAAVGEFLRGESSDLKPLGLHEARHTHVSLMHAAGCSLEEIGDFGGHSSTFMVVATVICSQASASAQPKGSTPTSLAHRLAQGPAKPCG
jgi:hypothetical protein